MKRREFLAACGGVAAAALALRPAGAWAADLPRDLKVTRIVAFDLVSLRPKKVGKNSRLGDHGDRATDRMVRLFTRAGLEGLGNCRADEATLAGLLGKDPLEFFKADEPAMKSPLGPGSMPLWDLAGKALGKPVHELLGGKGPRQVPVYDGSIYFADLMPEYADRWQDRFREEIDMAFKRGHRAFKIKIGRGAKWMPADEGYERDKAVLKVIRQHAGPDVLLGVDANNGYDLARTQRLLADLPDINLAFLEEMFPESLDQYQDLKAFLKEHKLKALIADGETQGSLEALQPFMEARAVDIYQLDMNRFGFEGILAEAAAARPQGLSVGPHNWGSLIGYYMILHVGRAITNLYRAENDPLDTDVVVADGYGLKDGLAAVPDSPGMGFKIDEARFAAKVTPKFDLKL